MLLSEVNLISSQFFIVQFLIFNFQTLSDERGLIITVFFLYIIFSGDRVFDHECESSQDNTPATQMDSFHCARKGTLKSLLPQLINVTPLILEALVRTQYILMVKLDIATYIHYLDNTRLIKYFLLKIINKVDV